MRCRHRSTLDAAALKRFGLKADARITSFVKRLRCTKCGTRQRRSRESAGSSA
jgi:hypothetical protein